MNRTVTLLVNPVSAGGRPLEVLPQVTAELQRLGVEHRSVETRSLEHAEEAALAAAAEGGTVAALGGDGMVRPVAAALRDTEARLAIIPAGRGNDFARVLGIPQDPAAAARTAVEGVERLVDVAEVDGVPYIGIASFGFDSDCNRIANETKLIRGNAVYLYSALRAVASWKPATYTITVDGERHEVTGWSVAVANSKAYGGGMYAAPQAELDDGLLDVVTNSTTSRRYLLFRTLPKVFKGAHLDLPNITTFSGEEISVDSDRPFDIYADGDPVGRTPATMRVRARCLRVIVPE